jgi:hypothetical protein
MKIKNIDGRGILFDNGNEIQVYHEIECCEAVYADFEQIDSIAYDLEFDENLKFERVEGYGFRFGNNKYNMVAVPCYDCQNGYYNSDLRVLYYHTHFAPESVLDSDSRFIDKDILEEAISEGYIDKDLSYDEQIKYFADHEDEIYAERYEKIEAEREESFENPKTQKYTNMFNELKDLEEIPDFGGRR